MKLLPLSLLPRAPSGRARRTNRARERRHGIAFVYTALGLAGLLMLAAVVVDLGLLYQRKAEMQRAADAAALAGAQRLANFRTSNEAYLYAGYIAGLPENGGYSKLAYNTSGQLIVVNKGNAKFLVTYPAKDENGVQHNNWFRVDINNTEPSLFGGMWPLKKSGYGVSASATALFERLAPLEIKGNGSYGVAPGPVNLSVFGPDGRYSYGDCYSTKFLNDGVTPNPKYQPAGYDFLVNVPANQGVTSLEIFDPDCYNSGGATDASATAIDEFRTRTGTGGPTNATTTQYSLIWDKGTADTSDDEVIQTKTWGYDSTTDMRWVNAFEFDRSKYAGGNFRLNVKSLSGSSENGFDLRVGPKRNPTTTTVSGKTTTTTPAFDPKNGATIQAEGHLPINFNISGTTKMTLGRVPAEAAGGELIITKFDTDINSLTIKYTCDKLPGMSWNGKLAADGTFETDTIKIPDSYKNTAADGTWYAEYVAGNQDTSVWDMSYTGNGPGKPGKIRLVR